MKPCEFKLSVLKLNSLKELKLEEELHDSLSNLSLCEFPALETLRIIKCSTLSDKKFPIIHFPTLKHLDLHSSSINSINNLGKSNIQSIESINLNGCPIEALPVLKLKKLLKFSLEGENKKAYLEDVSALAFWDCPSLVELNLSKQ